MTKNETISHWKKMIANDYAWAVRALVRIYENQTADEQEIGATVHHNSVGFNGVDAELLTSFAQQVKQGRSLSPRQRQFLHKKMPKYAGQLYDLVN